MKIENYSDLSQILTTGDLYLEITKQRSRLDNMIYTKQEEKFLKILADHTIQLLDIGKEEYDEVFDILARALSAGNPLKVLCEMRTISRVADLLWQLEFGRD